MTDSPTTPDAETTSVDSPTVPSDTGADSAAPQPAPETGEPAQQTAGSADETPEPEPTPGETAQSETPQPETPQPETPQPETPQPETGQTETAQPETSEATEPDTGASTATGDAPATEPEESAEAESTEAESTEAVPSADGAQALPDGTSAATEALATEAPGPRAPIPTPAMLAGKPKPPAAAPAPTPHAPPSDSTRFGRVGEDGTVYVKDGEGERAVGSYPGATADEALNYFARKYDELYAAADLLHQRIQVPDVTSKDIAEGLKALRKHIGEANVVGDLDALNTLVGTIDGELAAKRETESTARAAAKAEAQSQRESLVTQAEEIAAVPVERVQWKTASATMRSLLDTWKEHQRSGARLDKEIEAALWQRFSKARNSFDKARRSHFAELETTRSAARSTKEKLVAEAQALATSTDWAATSGAFKRLMDQWRNAGRASRSEDDSLWEQFKTAQDSFFNAKDEVVAAEDEEYRANLEVKLGLLAEAERLLPVTNLESAKAGLRVIQDKWDKAGKVPRADIDRTEKGIRRIEAAVRDAEEKKWRRTNPEVVERAQSLATQLETSVAKLESEVADAEAKGNTKKAADLRAKLEAQRAWLDQARGGLAEFGG